MGKYRKLTHTVYKCEYHIVWVPKYRYRILTGEIGRQVESDIRMICEWKDVEIEALSVQPDHVHLMCSIPPRISVSDFMGILKGKTAIKMFKRNTELKRKPYWGNHFWARGYFVSTIGLDEDKIRRYVQYQEEEEKKNESESKDFTLF